MFFGLGEAEQGLRTFGAAIFEAIAYPPAGGEGCEGDDSGEHGKRGRDQAAAWRRLEIQKAAAATRQAAKLPITHP